MKARLLSFLVCPECRGQMQCSVFEEDRTLPWLEILEGRLGCQECGREYPIHRGVPRMLPGQLAREVRETVEGFGWEWLTFNAQIQNGYMTSRANFLDFIHPSTERSFKGKVVLDAGCGMGRFLKLGAEFGSGEIIGVDLSQSVEAAYQNTRSLPNAHVVQADILALPFGRDFDFIFSVGVLHHMPDPGRGFSELARLLKPTGKIAAWVYSRENNGWVIRLLSPFRTLITSHLPRPVLYGISRVLGLALYGCLQMVYRPVNEVKVGRKLGRWLPYNEYLYYTSRLSYPAVVSVVFDHLVPQLAAYISRSEFERWFLDEKLSGVTISSRNNMSWRGQGTRVTNH